MRAETSPESDIKSDTPHLLTAHVQLPLALDSRLGRAERNTRRSGT